MEGYRWCTRCSQNLPISLFNRDKSKKDGYLNQCSPCRKASVSAIVRVVPEEKTCRDCEKVKPRSDFHRATSSGDGLQGLCKSCTTSFRHEKAELYRAIRRKYRETEAGQVVDYQIRQRRKLAKLGLSRVDYDPIEIYDREGGVCHICGEDVPKFKEVNGKTRRAFHVEHLIPLQVDPLILEEYDVYPHPGDVPWNVSVAHPECNGKKGNRVSWDDVERFQLYLDMYGVLDTSSDAVLELGDAQDEGKELDDRK